MQASQPGELSRAPPGLVEQARAGAPDGKIPLLAIHLAGEIRGNDLVIIQRADFEDLVGRLQKPEAGTLRVVDEDHSLTPNTQPEA